MTNTGAAAEWIGGIGSIAGTLVVGGGLWWEIHQRRKADKVALDEKRDAQKADARLISTVWEVTPGRCQVKVRNDGDGPVRNMSLWLRVAETGRLFEPIVARPEVGLLGGHAETQYDLIFEPREIPPYDEVDTFIEFTDAKGLRWRIANDDEPERIFERPGPEPATLPGG